jgi:hypothetical protein
MVGFARDAGSNAIAASLKAPVAAPLEPAIAGDR